MKYLKVFLQVFLLYGFFLAGDGLHDFFQLPLPGSIIGLLLLWASLLLKVLPLSWIDTGAHFLLSFLPLYFVPATVGAMNYGHVFAGKGILLILITVISTFLTIVISGHISQYFSRRSQKGKEQSPCK